MKKIILSITAAFLVSGLFGQAPDKMSFQSVLRNSSGTLLVEHAVGIKISVLQGSSTGTAVFEETHTATTNANGLVSLEIGGGTPVTGTIGEIDWSDGPYYIKTETDPSGGTSYSITGTTQLLSVPYALNAGNGNWTANGDDISSSNSGEVTIGMPLWDTNGKLQSWNTGHDGYAIEVVGENESFMGPAAQFWTKGQGPTMNIDWAGSGTDKLLTFKYFGNDVGHITTHGGAWFNDKVGIGTASPEATLDVAGNVKIADGTQGEGKVLTSDANGMASWGDGMSHYAAMSVFHYGQDPFMMTTDTEYNIHFGTTRFNDNIGYTEGAVTIPYDGVYHFDLYISFPYIFGNDYHVEIRVYINGALWSQEFIDSYGADLKLHQDDVVTFGIIQRSGETRELGAFSRLDCHRVN